MAQKTARHWLVCGTVQGVGFRYFVQKRATVLGLTGWVRNLNDGRVEVYATGSMTQLDELAASLHVGPRMAEVRSVEERETHLEQHSSFHIR